MSLGGALANLALLALTALVFLGPIQCFLRWRLARAHQRGDGHAYVGTRDPWLPAVVALTGAGLLALLRIVS